jgi:hypothetical protein
VPLEILEALMPVRATPFPDMLVKVPVVPVITLPAKDPLVSLATIVEAPLAEAAEVLALSIVPEEMLEALIPVRPPPSPYTFVKLPAAAATLVALTTLAVKLPFESRATIVLAPLEELAVV